MKFIIDTDKADKDIGVDGLLYLTAICLGHTINDDTFTKLNEQGLIVTNKLKDGRPYQVTPSKVAIEIVEGSYADMEITGINTDNRFTLLADKLRELFPTGRKSGTQLQWRDSTKIISQRLKAFIKKFELKENDFSDEDFIEATRRYINSFNGNYQYMQVLKYFIMKNKVEDGVNTINSQLLSFLQNKEDEETAIGDWNCELV